MQRTSQNAISTYLNNRHQKSMALSKIVDMAETKDMIPASLARTDKDVIQFKKEMDSFNKQLVSGV